MGDSASAVGDCTLVRDCGLNGRRYRSAHDKYEQLAG
jgi:hypothetical protein